MIDHLLKIIGSKLKLGKIHPPGLWPIDPWGNIDHRKNQRRLIIMPACFANSAECIMNFLLPIRPPGAGYIMQDARVLEGVHACVNSTTILPPTTLDEPLGEREEIYIYIYIIFNLPFTFYAAALYRFQLIKPRISFKTRSKCNGWRTRLKFYLWGAN